MISVFVNMYGKAYAAVEPISPLDSYIPYPSPILVATLLSSKEHTEMHIDRLREEIGNKMGNATEEQRIELLAAANDVILQHENDVA